MSLKSRDLHVWLDDIINELLQARKYLLNAEALMAAMRPYRRKLQATDAVSILNTTYWAHIEATLARLCRAYDKTGLGIEKLLKELADRPGLHDKSEIRRSLERHPMARQYAKSSINADICLDDIRKDIVRVSRADPQVAKLQRWRDKRLSHKTPEDIWDRKAFSARLPLRLVDMHYLIRLGLKVAGRYNFGLYNTNRFIEGDAREEFERMVKSLIPD